MARALALLLAAAAAATGRAQVAPDMAFFEVPTDGSGSHSATLRTASGASATCTMAYRTSSAAAPAAPAAPAPAPAAAEAPEAVLRRMDGQCAKQADAFWTYDICLGRDIVQSHGTEKYSLGRFVRTEGDTQIFEEGTYCPDVSQARSSAITFVCSGDTRVLSADEDRTCHYQFVVGTPAVCNNPAFRSQEQATASAHTRVGPGGAVLVPWVLEVFEQDGGALACTARAQDDLRGNGQASSAVTFTQASLTLANNGQFRGAAGDARHAMRVPVADADMEVAAQAGTAALTSGGGFRGTLEYLFVSGY